MAVAGRHRVRVHAQKLRVREHPVELLLDLLRPASDGFECAPALWAARARRFGVAAVVANQALRDGVIRQVHAAPRARRHIAALDTDKISGVPPPVEKEDRLPAGDDIVAQFFLQRQADGRRVSLPDFLLEIDDLRLRQRLFIVALFERI